MLDNRGSARKKITAANNHSARPLALRIVLSVMLATLVFALVISSIQIYRTYQAAVAEARQTKTTIEQNYLPILAAAMWSVDEARIEALMDSIIQLPHLGRLRLYDDASHSWQRTQPEFEQTMESHNLSISYQDNGETFVLGTLSLDLVRTQIAHELTNKALAIAITTVTSLLLCALLILIIIHWWISRHLHKMARYAERLDFNNLEQPLALERRPNREPDELDLVVEAINQMRIRVRTELNNRTRLNEELQLHRQHLETLVAERTQDLALKNTELEQQSQALREQNEDLDAYAHTVAHDLKQPLSNLAASASMLSAVGIGINLSEAKKRELLLIQQKSVTKMQAIIDSLLMLASVRKTNQQLFTQVDLKHSAEEACARLAPLIEQYQARVSFSGDWPKAKGHEQWIEEIWANYLSNALKYAGKAPQIELGCKRLDDQTIRCWVKDSGEGLTDAQQHNLFDAFVRFNTNSAEGHGLGLSIVKRIARALGGEVGYEKIPQGGSLFWFSLAAVD